MFRMFTISHRMFMILIFTLIIVGGLVYSLIHISNSATELSAQKVGEMFYEGQKQRIRDLSTTMANSIGEQISGITDITKRNAIIASAIKKARYEKDSSGYFFVYDGGIVVAHVFPDLVGKDLGNSVDKNGVRFNAELAKKAAEGGGFVTFVFNKPGGGTQSKIAYGAQVPGTSLWVGAGVYIDNVDRDEIKLHNTMHVLLTETLTTYGGGFLAILLLLVIPLSYHLVTSITRPLGSITGQARAVAAGDLDVHIAPTGKDEVAVLEQALRDMVGNLKRLIGQAAEKSRQADAAAAEARAAQGKAEQAGKNAQAKTDAMLVAADKLEQVAHVVSTASTQLAAQIEQSDKGALDAANRLTDAATAMNEMNATVQSVARNASEASAASRDTRERAIAGAHIVEQSVYSIGQVHEVSRRLTENMGQLNDQAQAISKIMNVISDIADQTNLLALNAAIEAARAGDAGRGFAVVADEVRKLAEKTMASTTEVGRTIAAIQSSARESTSQMDEAVVSIEEATHLVNLTGTALQEIVSMADVTADQVHAIATAAEQQSATSEEINRSLTNINGISGEVVNIMHESAKAVQEVSTQADVLNGLMEEMKKSSSV